MPFAPYGTTSIYYPPTGLYSSLRESSSSTAMAVVKKQEEEKRQRAKTSSKSHKQKVFHQAPNKTINNPLLSKLVKKVK